jgi:hypothetical protein
MLRKPWAVPERAAHFLPRVERSGVAMPMQDGLYKVHFRTPLGVGSGVVTLLGGKLRGGDSMICYTGTYTQNGNQFAAQVETDAHSPSPVAGMKSVFGPNKANISFLGMSNGNAAQLQGTSPQTPGVPMQATLTWIGP